MGRYVDMLHIGTIPLFGDFSSGPRRMTWILTSTTRDDDSRLSSKPDGREEDRKSESEQRGFDCGLHSPRYR